MYIKCLFVTIHRSVVKYKETQVDALIFYFVFYVILVIFVKSRFFGY